MAAIPPTMMTVKLLGFRPSPGNFPVTFSEVPAKIRCMNFKMHVPFSRRSTNPRLDPVI
ncbi:hypothetical protein Hdeb2414_s0116g00801551 [Helianthus debilis subsp. tardiflorus]